MKKYGILDGVPLRTTHAHAVSIMLLQIRKYMFKDWDISCLQGMIGTYHVLTSFFLLLFLSSMVTDEGSLNVCAGAGRVCSHCTGAGSCRRRRTDRKMTVVVEVTTRG